MRHPLTLGSPLAFSPMPEHDECARSGSTDFGVFRLEGHDQRDERIPRSGTGFGRADGFFNGDSSMATRASNPIKIRNSQYISFGLLTGLAAMAGCSRSEPAPISNDGTEVEMGTRNPDNGNDEGMEPSSDPVIDTRELEMRLRQIDEEIVEINLTELTTNYDENELSFVVEVNESLLTETEQNGLTFKSGVIRGQIITSGTFDFNIWVEDSGGNRITDDLRILIGSENSQEPGPVDQIPSNRGNDNESESTIKSTFGGYDVTGSGNVDILRLPGSRSDYGRIGVDAEGNVFIERINDAPISSQAVRQRFFQANEDGEENPDPVVEVNDDTNENLERILQEAVEPIVVSEADAGAIISLTDIEAIQFADEDGDDVLANTLFTPDGLEEAAINDGTSHNDILVGAADDNEINGRSGDDVLTGLDGDDVLMGGEGDDIIHGGKGNDTVDGGDGSNWLYGESLADADDNGGEDFDKVYLNGKISDWKIRSSIDILEFEVESAEFNLKQDLRQDLDPEEDFSGRLVSGISFENKTNDDVNFVWGFEEIHFVDGDETQIVQVSSSDFGTENQDFMLGRVNQEGNVFYDKVAVNFYDNANDIMAGGDGNDYIWGLGGDDGLYGGRGDDFISGGRGDDIIDGGEGIDTVYYENSFYRGRNPDSDSNDFNFNEYGHSHSIDGDQLNGKINIEVRSWYTSEVLSEGGDELEDVEILQFGDNQKFEIIALNSDNTNSGEPVGTENDEIILGTLGGDTIHVEDGDDIIIGGGGTDAIYLGTGNNTVYGGGLTTVIFPGMKEDYTFTRIQHYRGEDYHEYWWYVENSEEETLYKSNEVGYIQFENGEVEEWAVNPEFDYTGRAIGSALNDDIRSDYPRTEIILADYGDDTIRVYHSDAEVRGGYGNDTIHVNRSDLTVYGEYGDDIFYSGDDLSYFESNASPHRAMGNTFDGGHGEDKFIYSESMNEYDIWKVQDTIYVQFKGYEKNVDGEIIRDTLTSIETIQFGGDQGETISVNDVEIREDDSSDETPEGPESPATPSSESAGAVGALRKSEIVAFSVKDDVLPIETVNTALTDDCGAVCCDDCEPEPCVGCADCCYSFGFDF